MNSSQNKPTMQTDSANGSSQDVLAQKVQVQEVQTRQTRIQRLKFLGIALVCLAPVIFSYAFYYLRTPSKTSNYGMFIEPQRPAQDLKLTLLDGKPLAIDSFRKRFIMVTTDQANCDEQCAKRLYTGRQIHAMTGKERERIERLWIIPKDPQTNTTTAVVPDPKILAAHEGLIVAYADTDALKKLLPIGNDSTTKEHIFLIDVQGNLMMRFPKEPDPYKVKKDLMTLLKAATVR
jgi:hypothetical protein